LTIIFNSSIGLTVVSVPFFPMCVSDNLLTRKILNFSLSSLMCLQNDKKYDVNGERERKPITLGLFNLTINCNKAAFPPLLMTTENNIYTLKSLSYYQHVRKTYATVKRSKYSIKFLKSEILLTKMC